MDSPTSRASSLNQQDAGWFLASIPDSGWDWSTGGSASISTTYDLEAEPPRAVPQAEPGN
ncbi:MAG: hypothetical protein F6K19_14240 [Cyanothece sp. SIO1E1]|nr:hypothetical protein [Cyanothece sp. SIO1E1]